VKAIQQYEALMQGTLDMCALSRSIMEGNPSVCLSSETSYWEPGDSVPITSRTAKSWMPSSPKTDQIPWVVGRAPSHLSGRA